MNDQSLENKLLTIFFKLSLSSVTTTQYIKIDYIFTIQEIYLLNNEN